MEAIEGDKQRIELAKSGKLNREGVDLDALLKFCSAKEAVEIMDITGV